MVAWRPFPPSTVTETENAWLRSGRQAKKPREETRNGSLWGLFCEARFEKVRGFYLYTCAGSSSPAARAIVIPLLVVTAPVQSISVIITGHAHMTGFIDVLLSIVA